MRAAGKHACQVEESKLLYLAPTEFIDFEDETVSSLAVELSQQSSDKVDYAKRAFEYVRDSVSHAYDVQLHVPAARASEVLRAGGSICWGKANLLAALLRAQGVPSGISYQILTQGETSEAGYMVHALNTAFIDGRGWIRLDARGNKEGIDAQFSLDCEKLAYDMRTEAGEIDFHNNLPDADPVLMALIGESDDILQVSSDDVLLDFKKRMSSSLW